MLNTFRQSQKKLAQIVAVLFGLSTLKVEKAH